MKLQLVNTTQKNHNSVQELLSNALIKKGYTIDIIDPLCVATDDSVLATISLTASCFEPYNSLYRGATKPYIRVEHGIYFYKQWAEWVCYDYFDLFLTSTQYPIDFYYKHYKDLSKNWNAHKEGNVMFNAIDGWCKLDLYYKYNNIKDTIKTEVYKKYNLDMRKPLVVYAPTWVRGDGTRKLWIEDGQTPEAFVNQGSGNLINEVKQNLSKLRVNLICLPHYVGSHIDELSTLELDDRIKLMVASDLLIGDVSSMVAEYTVLDKPIVILKKKIADRDVVNHKIYQHHSQPILDVGDIVDIRELADVVKYRLVHDDYKAIRNHWKRKLVISDKGFDGNCANREADAIDQFIKEYYAK